MKSGIYCLSNRVPWRPDKPDQCRQEAEDMAGPSPHGYLYRLQKDRANGQICLSALKIEKLTPCGWRVRLNRSETMVVLKKGRKFAYPTVEEALKNFILRWEWWAKRLRWQIQEANETIQQIKYPDRHKELNFLDQF